MTGPAYPPAYRINQCPVTYVSRFSRDLLELHHSCKKWGTLPLAGGFLDQPSQWMHGFAVIEEELHAITLERHAIDARKKEAENKREQIRTSRSDRERR